MIFRVTALYTFVMSLNGYEYQSEVFKLSGFALMTPFGRLMLNLLENGFNGILTNFNFIGAMLLFLLGLWFIQRGYKISDERG